MVAPKDARRGKMIAQRRGAGFSRALGGASFEPELLASREKIDRFAKTPRLGFLLLGRIDPSDVHAPV